MELFGYFTFYLLIEYALCPEKSGERMGKFIHSMRLKVREARDD